VRLTAWLILSVLTIEPTLAHAAAGDLPDRKSPTATQGTPTPYTVDFTWAAATHPEYFLQPTPAGTRIVLDDHVSLKDAAVFVDGRRVADLQEFVVTIRAVR